MTKKISTYLLFFIFQSILFFFIIDYILLPLLTNDKEEIYLNDVRGMLLDDAIKILDKFEIELFNQKYSKGTTPGTVTSMSPRAFTLVKEGKVIKLTVIAKPTTMIIDDYINKSYRDIQLKLDREEIEIDTLIYEFSHNVKKGYIIDQYPKFLDTLDLNEKLTLIISQGKHPNYYIVPNLVNLSLIKAKQKISRAGFMVGKLIYEYNNDYLNNTVLEQNHPPNKRLSFPAKIDLILSTDKGGK